MKSIYVIDRENKLRKEIAKVKNDDICLEIQQHIPEELEIILKNIPEIIIINEDSLIEGEDIIEICKSIREDQDNSITPIIVVSSNHDIEHKIEILRNEVELYIETPVNGEILYYNIRNILRLLNSNRMVSPLTGLPGNVQIQAELKKRLSAKSHFAMLYLDLDNFKSYNDTYGFEKGDELIKFTARTIVKHVIQQDSCSVQNFVGHIGGDDFVAIVDTDDYEKICQSIIAEFDMFVLEYFTEEDAKRGYIEVENRRGIMEEFPLTSLSIGVVEVNSKRFQNTLEIGEAGASVKHLAKTIYGSTYVIDRRKAKEEPFSKVAEKILHDI